MSFWGELKRRNVYKVGVAYAIVAWLLIQAAAIVSPALQLPNWMLPVVIVLLCIGFPVVLIIAWAFEVTPEGIKKTKDVPLSESITHLTGRKLNYILAGVIILGVAYIAFDKFYLDRRANEPEMVSTGTKQVPAASEAVKTKKTIAVLPFENLSSDPEQLYFVDGLTEEILNSLCQIPDLLVTGRTSSFSFKASHKTAQEIAEILGVENILEGSVRKAGNILRITAQLLRAKDGFHLWSKSYDRELKDIADILSIQEDIAKAVANEFKLTLGIGETLRQLGGTDNVEAYGHYLVSRGQMWNAPGNLTFLNKCLDSLDVAISLDPAYAHAWAQKALNHLLLAVYVPKEGVSVELDAALKAAQRATQLEPDLPEAYVALNGYYTMKSDWIEAEKAVQKALELSAGASTEAERNAAGFYNAVGFLKKAQAIYEKVLQNDPINKIARADYMLGLAFQGNIYKAEEEYKLGMKLFEGDWEYGDSFISAVRLGYKNPITLDQIPYSSLIFDAVKEHLESPENMLSELSRMYTSGENLSHADLTEISLLAAYSGDAEFALEVMWKAIHLNAAGIFDVWHPVMKEVRQLLRFKEFVREIGLVDYWNKFGWPDICHKLDNGDFECD